MKKRSRTHTLGAYRPAFVEQQPPGEVPAGDAGVDLLFVMIGGRLNGSPEGRDGRDSAETRRMRGVPGRSLMCARGKPSLVPADSAESTRLEPGP